MDVAAGETIATAVGGKHEDGTLNVSFDFGVFDRWMQNAISQDPDWQVHEEYGMYENEHGLCWLDLLPSADSARLKALPGTDWQSGKTSDYCL